MSPGGKRQQHGQHDQLVRIDRFKNLEWAKDLLLMARKNRVTAM